MQRLIEGADRGQSTLLPECLEDWVDESNLICVIDAFVDALKLAMLEFEGTQPVPHHGNLLGIEICRVEKNEIARPVLGTERQDRRVELDFWGSEFG
jgi:hypothetical protein